jgi:hypothetical protein
MIFPSTALKTPWKNILNLQELAVMSIIALITSMA